MLASLLWRRTSKPAVAAGLVAGVALVLYLVIAGHDPIWGLNAGIVALIANALVLVLGSLLFPSRAADGEISRIMTQYAPLEATEAGTRESAGAPGTR